MFIPAFTIANPIMKNINYIFIFIFCLFWISCKQNSDKKTGNTNEFAKEMVEFVPYSHNPLFSGTNADTWDELIRERGYIMFESGLYKMWYTGYNIGYLKNSNPQDPVKAEIMGICIGDFVIVTLPAEAFARIGLNIKETSPYKNTFLASYSNGYLHYAPTADAYKEWG
jgi:hypothetical protein